MQNKLSDLLTEINSLESISSAWGVLRSRGYWSLWSSPELDEQVANELRDLRVELADLVAKRDALLAEDGLIWRDGAAVRRMPRRPLRGCSRRRPGLRS